MIHIPDGAQTWFAVLPDCGASLALADRLRPGATRMLRYPSGRPWLIGHWAAGEAVTVSAGQARLVVAGQHPATTRSLAPHVQSAPDAGTLDRLAASLPGCYHLAAAIGSTARVQGSVSGLRRVYYTRTAGVTVASDRAAVLAALTGAPPDEHRLVLELIYPKIPEFADAGSLWRGIRMVPHGCHLRLSGDGSADVVRWWQPPDPALPIAEAAPRLRDALATAVELRTRGRETVSCDLSGGLDSTSVCFLTARHSGRVVAVTMRGADPAHDDAQWADQASTHLPGLQRLLLDPHDLPDRYASMTEVAGGLDEPAEMGRDLAPLAYICAQVRAQGSALHLTGHGGDHLFAAHPGYLHSMAREHPWAALRHLRASRAQHRWPLTSLRGITDRQDYRSWSSATAAALTAGPARRATVLRMEWGMRAALPPWVSAAALESARGALRAAAARAEPLAPQRGQHAVIEQVHHCAAALRPLAQMMRQAGVTMAAPYLDDRVAEAVLSVAMHERAVPGQYKPLLGRAMDGIVPAAILARRTKGEFGAEGRAGLRRHRAELAALFDEPMLGRLGLIDADAVRGAVLGRHQMLPPCALARTLACEIWLRAHQTAPRQPAGAR